ncbi:non-ribosomal peptide synthetase, partial [Gorillibacterium massiliense]|uniref:non-ribosomal peptide synthetase n=1 Tax=Gorillibacterium massiliense TaxID=1280390 RepID=UPI0012DEAF05
AGRNHESLEEIVGFFVNTLPIRLRFNGQGTMGELIQTVKTACLESYEHQAYPFDLIVEQVNPEREAASSAMLTTMFQFMPAITEKRVHDSLKMRVDLTQGEDQTSKFDLFFTVTDAGQDTLSLAVNYDTGLFSQGMVTQFMHMYEQILAAMVEASETPLAELDLLGKEDRELYTALNAAAMPYRDELTLAEAFYETAERFSGRMAVVTEERRLTYGELNEASNRVAHMLLAHGMKPGDFATLLMERSIETVVSLLGVLKAGGVYVPVDPEYPEERIRYMLSDSGSRYVLTKKAHAERVAGLLDGEEGERV